jgi:hypothetical protein
VRVRVVADRSATCDIVAVVGVCAVRHDVLGTKLVKINRECGTS